MKLEEEIKQVKFKDEYAKLVINILFTSNWLKMINRTVLNKAGLTYQQYNVLRILKGQKGNPSTLLLIRERMLDKESNASRLVDKLEKSELVIRKQCENDRRQVDIYITEKGLLTLEEVTPKLDALQARLRCLTEEEAFQLNDLLDKIRG